MSERPTWMKVVGGKDHIPKETQNTPDAPEPEKESSEVSDFELIRLNKEIRANLPADYKSVARKELIAQAAGAMMSWSVAELYTALSQPDIWERPSHTVAALEEVRLRMAAGSMAPRKGR